ncbi:N-acetyltransferase family protein [Bdellovibrio sp. HCB209]|uniref:GNAT family N-acetyltransferase n=1 Tax=Bdellovibrio sp. HCB209 TaxID=3394354 RepID=UPI0039B43019
MKIATEVFTTKKNQTVTLRAPVLADAGALRQLMVGIAETAPYIASTAEDIRARAVDAEEKWVEKYNSDARSMIIVAEVDGQIVGNLEFSGGTRSKTLHLGHLGMGVSPGMRGHGIGELLLKKLFAEASRIEGLTQIELSVMHPNVPAHNLYKKVGFQDCGRKPNAFRLEDGTWADEVAMFATL